ncbi:LPD7 domain-containing protein (plasmid) [Sphingomonas citri]
MSAQNSIARGAREPTVQAEPIGLDIPPELQSRYEVRLVEVAGTEPRIGLFRLSDRETPAIEITADRIVARREDAETIDSLVRIAQHNGWDRIDVDGTPEFRKAVWAAAAREGLAVSGYEPSFAEQERLTSARRDDTPHRARRPVEQPLPVAQVDAEETISARSAEKTASEREQPDLAGSSLSDVDSRLLLKVSALTEDRRALQENLRSPLAPLEREVLYERIDENRGALDGALERALESPTVRNAFERAGYTPDALREMGRGGEWDSDVADAIYLVRSGLRRDALPRDAGSRMILADRADTERADGAAAEPNLADRTSAGQTPAARAEEAMQQPAAGRPVGDELADLFLHGAAERVAADPRLAGALQAQSAMEQHIGEVFDGDATRMASATLESRQMISDVLRRGLDVSVREPTPVRQIEPIHALPDLER